MCTNLNATVILSAPHARANPTSSPLVSAKQLASQMAAPDCSEGYCSRRRISCGMSESVAPAKQPPGESVSAQRAPASLPTRPNFTSPRTRSQLQLTDVVALVLKSVDRRSIANTVRRGVMVSRHTILSAHAHVRPGTIGIRLAYSRYGIRLLLRAQHGGARGVCVRGPHDAAAVGAARRASIHSLSLVAVAVRIMPLLLALICATLFRSAH
jgi:hypothetical protein